MHRHELSAAPLAPLASKVLRPLERFLQIEASSGLVLLAATVAALAWANSTASASYQSFWHAPFTIGFGSFVAQQPLHFWINDGLMTIFFLVVGLEIRREIHEGALGSLRAAALPVAAALGGILVPALMYLALNPEPPLRQGWAVPTATDIAFAVGVLALLGKRVPPALRVLLLTSAIVDDIAAILVIALFYSAAIVPAGFMVVAAGFAGVIALQKLGVGNAFAYVLPGGVVWLGLLYAGIHPTLAGVILGLLTPATSAAWREPPLAVAARALDEFRKRRARAPRDPQALIEPIQELKLAQREMLSPLIRIEAVLHPWVAYGIMPLFALANAGVVLSIPSQASAAMMSVPLGIILALVVGKPLGILVVAALSVKARMATLPEGVTWRGVLLVGCLGGIGFTMSLFIATLAFADESLLASAKLAVLIGSVIAALAGLVIGKWALPLRENG